MLGKWISCQISQLHQKKISGHFFYENKKRKKKLLQLESNISVQHSYLTDEETKKNQ